MVSAPQPQPRLRRLHRLSDRSKELVRQRIEIDLIAHLPGEPVECPLRVVPGPAPRKGWRSRRAIPPTSNATARRGRIPRPQRPGGGARSSQRHSLTGWPSGERHGIPHRNVLSNSWGIRSPRCNSTASTRPPCGGRRRRSALAPHHPRERAHRAVRLVPRNSLGIYTSESRLVPDFAAMRARRLAIELVRPDRGNRSAVRHQPNRLQESVLLDEQIERPIDGHPCRSTSGITCENDGLALVRYPSGRCIERSPFDGSTVTSPQCPTTGHRPPPTLSRCTRVNSSHTPSGLAGIAVRYRTALKE